MICPACEQCIGHDHYHVGEWVEQPDATNSVNDCTRQIVVDCEHCGLFEVEQGHDRRIRSIRGPFTNTRDVRRLAKCIPARRTERRIPA